MKRRWISGGLASGILIGVCWLGICGLHGAPAQEEGGRSAAKHRGAKNPLEGKLVEISLAGAQPSTTDVDRLWEQVRFEKLHGRTFLVGRVVGSSVDRYVAWDSVQDFCVFDSRAQYDEFLRSRLGRALDGISSVLGDLGEKADIHTIRVPAIDLGEGRAAFGEWLTEAVVKEIERTTPLRVSHSPDAESVLSCKVDYHAEQSDAVKPRGTISGSLVVRWTDRNGNKLRPAFSAPLPTLDSPSDAPFPESGRSLTSSDQRNIEGLARQIVEKMEPAW